MRIAVYAGTFDPITAGHLSVIEAAAEAFDRLIVLVAVNPDKHPLFNGAERQAMIEGATEHLEHVAVDTSTGLVVEYARAHGAGFLIRGIRDASDADYETQLANVNRNIAPEVTTFFVPAHTELSRLSSSNLKEMARRGEDGSAYCPALVWQQLVRKLAEQQNLPHPHGKTEVVP
ncbi:MAG: pantetheine-phosphate adenylyltransferase [Deltaproteobacteria bacterium RIFOXYA12_FULL_58_15]|nr:MAG: pantetheine-phosphate adenylyltransferase [Deltaproteobacteria bacterium RIFOXYA12_FULL_58_15]OGR08731.1 MAG: pantetheine-phosphate adenylyltransferase [Deltaproteobacteria bacterium RIFOXYB12_FULL_58_9]